MTVEWLTTWWHEPNGCVRSFSRFTCSKWDTSADGWAVLRRGPFYCPECGNELAQEDARP